jgi:hypothetical protein
MRKINESNLPQGLAELFDKGIYAKYNLHFIFIR